ncbi:hypothetical protein AV530_019381 [Patagioenas fasciata monilis]|uniref:Uncharacterized protein n=1 Tax=Patagioenas fasciata monilis TaxID=372326 RepID=A0A1V4JDQ6_PATFA|nr:hypothetical protein AV530_019381 [Patagioenas fasciata monilis]
MQVPGRPAVFSHAGSRAQQPSRCVALRQAHKRAAAAAPVSPLRRGVGTGPAAASRVLTVFIHLLQQRKVTCTSRG